MNVCFLLGGFQSNGGIGRVTSILANELCEKEGLTIHTIAYCQTNKPLLYNLSNKIHQHKLFSSSTSMLKAMILKGAIKQVRRILREQKIDVLIAAGALFYPLAIQAVKGTHAKCYCWEHTDPGTTHDHRGQGRCRRYAVKRADKMIVLTRSAQRYYVEALNMDPEKLYHIYNPISNSQSNTLYDPTSKKIIAVGRLTYQKNFDRLIKLAARFLPNTDWSLDIYGQGEERQMLLDMIYENGLSNHIRLMGQVDNLYDRYPQYAFQVMSSRYEGFPMSLLEGATHRLPLVAFDIPTGPNEIIMDGENGFLVDRQDDDRMVACIRLLMEDASLRQTMSDNAYRMVQMFKLNDIIEQWCEIL